MHEKCGGEGGEAAHLQPLRRAAGLPKEHGHERGDAAAKGVAGDEERPVRVLVRGAGERLGRVAVHKRGGAQHALMHVPLALKTRQVHRDRLRVQVRQ